MVGCVLSVTAQKPLRHKGAQETTDGSPHIGGKAERHSQGQARQHRMGDEVGLHDPSLHNQQGAADGTERTGQQGQQQGQNPPAHGRSPPRSRPIRQPPPQGSATAMVPHGDVVKGLPHLVGGAVGAEHLVQHQHPVVGI